MTSESSFSEALIDLVFDKFANFVEQYSAQVSLAGMFLKTTDLKAVGTPVSIEIKLSDGYRLIQAVGEVTWVCLESTGQHPQGLAIRFHALDESGRGLLLKIIEEQSKSGGATFDIAQVPPGAIVERGQPKVIPTSTADSAQAPGDEIAFDAPWGDKLPDLPVDILESEPSTATEKPPAPPLAAAGRRAAPPPTELPVALPLEDEEDPGEQAAFSIDAPDIELSQPALETVDPKASQDADPMDGDLDATTPSRRDAGSAVQPPPAAVDLSPESAPPAEAPPAEARSAEAPPAVDEPLFGELPPSFELADEAGFTFDEDPEEIDFTQDLPTVDAAAPDLPAVDEAVADGTGGLDEVYEIDEPSEEASATPSPLEALSSPSPQASASESAPAPSRDEPPYEPLLPDLDESASIEPPAHSPPPPAASSGSFLEQTSSEPIAPSLTETREGPPGLFDEGPSYPSVAASPAPPSLATEEIDEVSDDATDVGDSTNSPYYYYNSGDEAGEGPRRWLVPAAIAVVLVVLAGVGYLQRDTLMGLIGLGAAAPQDVAPPAATPPEEDAGLEDPPLQAQDDLAAPGLPSAEDTAISTPEESGRPGRSKPSGPPPPIASASRPAERIQDISWRSSPSGTRVLIQADGALQPARLQHNRLTAPTVRELIKVSRIVEPYQENILEVGTPELIRIRLGHHPRPEGTAELHIVFDLPDGAVELTELTPRGERLEVFLRRSP